MRIGTTLFGVSLSMICAAGCAPTTAIVNGQQVPRQNLVFAGRPYDVRHSGAHPAPGGPSSGIKDDGGHISGHVCGLAVRGGRGLVDRARLGRARSGAGRVSRALLSRP